MANLRPVLWRVAGPLIGLAVLGGTAFYMLRPAHESGASPVRQDAASPVDETTRARIDTWLAQNHLNPYGDAAGTHYAGGTPLFNERTGDKQERYEYILSKHPELKYAPKK